MNFLKRSIGDLLSLIVGSNDEDYEPTKEHYVSFIAILVCIALFVLAYLFG